MGFKFFMSCNELVCDLNQSVGNIIYVEAPSNSSSSLPMWVGVGIPPSYIIVACYISLAQPPLNGNRKVSRMLVNPPSDDYN